MTKRVIVTSKILHSPQAKIQRKKNAISRVLVQT